MIYEILKKYHARGEGQAVSTEKLMRLTGFSQRQIRRLVQLEKRKHFICGNLKGGGYFRPLHRSDIEHEIKKAERRIMSAALSVHLARRASRKAREGQTNGKQEKTGKPAQTVPDSPNGAMV